jgi:hypothetical protein|tara:strand:- start:696 stop:914 length:219 start_codon:yes stop_codon:yes gene_type:complete
MMKWRLKLKHSMKNSMPSLEEAIEDLKSLLTLPKYNTTKSGDDIAREQAYYAGQFWAVKKLEAIALRWKEGA